MAFTVRQQQLTAAESFGSVVYAKHIGLPMYSGGRASGQIKESKAVGGRPSIQCCRSNFGGGVRVSIIGR